METVVGTLIGLAIVCVALAVGAWSILIMVKAIKRI